MESMRFSAGKNALTAAVVGILLAGVPGASQADPGPDEGPAGEGGVGSKSFSSPHEISADDGGLKYSIPLPYYQANALYAETVEGESRALTQGAQHRLGMGSTKQWSTPQNVPRGGDGGSWRNTMESVLGAVLKAVADKVNEMDPTISGPIAEQVVDTVFGLNRDSGATVSKAETVSFAVSDEMVITPMRNDITARPVFYKARTVSDEWRRSDSGDLELTGSNIVSDVVLKKGWLLECPQDGGGKQVCRPGKDYKGVDIETPSGWPEGGVDLPPMKAAGGAFESSEVNENGVRWRWTGPAECTVSSTGRPEHKFRSVWDTTPQSILPLSVKCPIPENQSDLHRAYSGYRLKYSVEGESGGWRQTSAGTVSQPSAGDARWDLPENFSDSTKMANQDGIPANGRTFRYGLTSNAKAETPYASPKWRVDIIPVEADVEPRAVIGPVTSRGHIFFDYQFSRPGDKNLIRVYRRGADIHTDAPLANETPNSVPGRHRMVISALSWPTGNYTVHAMTERDGRLVSLASRDFRA
ncbi:hypothetical protein [Streptomyces violaceoruber]|uniref:hypothetical protein n=1 Tax=Streptomyces violaceoruber TaxID=1935 RepID=UPI003B435BF6